MPTYEYACAACGHQWEQSQRITEAPVEVCPTCGKPAAHRLISRGTNFILKGGGWYSDLYGSPKPSSGGSSSGSSGSGGASSGSSDSSGGGATKPSTSDSSTPSPSPSPTKSSDTSSAAA